MLKYHSKCKVSIGFTQPAQPTTFVFHDSNKEVGRITIKDGRMAFSGEVDESAKVFFDCLCNNFPQLKDKGND